MNAKPANGHHGARGFSLIELMIVLVISLVVAAFAVPNISAAITNIRLRGSVSNVAGLLQQCRILAVKSNKIEVARIGTTNNASMVFVDVDFNNSYSPPNGATGVAGEPVVQMTQGVSVDFIGPAAAFPAATLLGYSQLPSLAPFNVGFNQRGLPCTPNSAVGTVTVCAIGGMTFTTTSNAGYLYYFKIKNVFGDSWAALTITPAGRIRVWTLNGTTWS